MSKVATTSYYGRGGGGRGLALGKSRWRRTAERGTDGTATTMDDARRSPAKLFLPLPPPSLVSDSQTELNKMYSIRLLIVSRIATHVNVSWLSPEHRPPASLEGDGQTNWKKLFHSSVRR